MIIKQEVVDYKTNKKTEEQEPIYKQALNLDYWKKIKVPINVVLDEAHSIINSRRSMSKINVIITDWLTLIRRILGSNDSGHGELVLITQLPNRLDSIARDMCTQVRYCRCHYKKTCPECFLRWSETSDDPEKQWSCFRCGSFKIVKHRHIIEVWKFANMNDYMMWNDIGQETFYDHYFMPAIEQVFPLYNSLQWENLFSEFYT